jgi:hypothetical protein
MHELANLYTYSETLPGDRPIDTEWGKNRASDGKSFSLKWICIYIYINIRYTYAYILTMGVRRGDEGNRICKTTYIAREMTSRIARVRAFAQGNKKKGKRDNIYIYIYIYIYISL